MIPISQVPSSNNNHTPKVVLIVRRILIVIATLFIITAATFYSIQTKIDNSSVYQMNSASEQLEETTFSIFRDTFRAYVLEAFPGMKDSK